MVLYAFCVMIWPWVYGGQEVEWGGSNKKSPIIAGLLHTWFPIWWEVCDVVRGVALLRKCVTGTGFRISRGTRSLCPDFSLRCALQALLVYHKLPWSPGRSQQEKSN